MMNLKYAHAQSNITYIAEENRIQIDDVSLDPITVMDAAMIWLHHAKQRGWELRDHQGTAVVKPILDW